MAYATHADVQATYGEERLTKITPVSSVSEADFWADLLDAASQEMDTYFSRAGYATPIPGGSSVANLLKRWCVALALEFGQPGKSGEHDPVREAASRARAALGRVASGAQRLTVSLPDKAIAFSDSESGAANTARYGAHPFRDLRDVIRATREIGD